MKQVGWRVYFDPQGQITHYGQQTGRLIPVWSMVQKYRNFHRFCRVNGLCSSSQLLLLKGVFMVASVIRIGLWGFRMLNHDRVLSRGMLKAYWGVLKQAPSF
jgi:GT2 family glycosyltransferase